jgi:hypothetical protein
MKKQSRKIQSVYRNQNALVRAVFERAGDARNIRPSEKIKKTPCFDLLLLTPKQASTGTTDWGPNKQAASVLFPSKPNQQRQRVSSPALGEPAGIL